MNLGQSNTSNSLFGGGSGGGSNSLFGSSGGGSGGGGGTPMFGGKNTPNKNLLGGGSGGLGSLGQGSRGTIGVKYQPQRGKENHFVASITSQTECRGKSLDELRIEDYVSMKSGQVPDSVQNKINQNMQGGSTGSLGGGLLGGGGSGGSSGGGNSLFGSGSGGGQQGGGNLPSLSLQRGNVIPGSGGNNQQGGGLLGGSGGGNTGGGLFGGGNKQGGGLLGGGGNQQGGGLLGGGNKQGGGLFGSNQGGGNQGGGLLGGGGNQGGGLLGNKQGGGLLGGGGGTGGGGLFSGNNNQGGGLLGGNKQGGGLLGGGGSGGGLFSGNNQQGGSGGGLFSGNNQGGGLLGNKQGGGLFSGQGQGQGQGQGGGLFSGQGQGQGGGLFSGQGQGQQQMANPHLFANLDMLRMFLENMDPAWRAKLMENLPGKGDAAQKEKEATGTEKKEPTGSYIPYKPQEGKSDNKDQGYGRKKTLNEMAMSLGERSSLQKKGEQLSTSNYVPFDIRNGKKLEETQKKVAETFGLNRRFGPHSVVKKLTHEDLYDNNSSYLDDRIEIQLRPKTIYRSKESILQDLNESQASINTIKKGGRSIYNSSVVVDLDIYIKGKKEERPLRTRIFSKATIQELKLKALEILFELGRLQNVVTRVEELDALAGRTELCREGDLFTPDLYLDQAGINENNNRAVLLIEARRQIPNLTKRGYYTHPPMREIETMNDHQLRYVENFSIWNEFGRIEWEGETDIRGLDLDELVHIQQGLVEVYPEAKFPTEASKPKRGEKLNKPAVITLFKCFTKKKSKHNNNNNNNNNSRLVGTQDALDDVEVLGHNQNSGEYQIRVLHFTRYGFDPSESDEEEEQQKHKQQPTRDIIDDGQRVPNFGAFIAHIPKPTEIRTSGGPEGFTMVQDHRGSQRRGIGFADLDKDDLFAESQGSESGKLRDLIGDHQLGKGGQLQEDELFGQSDGDDEQETYSQQFRRRHGAPGQKIIKGAQGRIYMQPMQTEPPEIETETEGLEQESGKEEQGEEMIEEKMEEYNTQSKMAEFINLADNFVAVGRARLQRTELGRNISFQLKGRCQNAVNKLGILNKRIVGRQNELINPNQREFYMNRSFRVGWTRNGLVTTRGAEVSVHKVIVHRDLGLTNPEDPTSFVYDRYRKNLVHAARNLYEPLLKALVNNSTNMDEIAQLTLSESSQKNKKATSFLKFPDAGGLASALIEYVERVGNKQLFREEGDEARTLVIAEMRIREVEILSLLNTLFGQCELDLWDYAIKFEREQISEEDRNELKEKLERSVEREKQNIFMRKHGLSKWLERKSGQFVERDINLFEDRTGREIPITEEILLCLSGKQLRRATETCNQRGLGRLALLISSLSGNSHTKERVAQQLREWENSRYLDNISHKSIYEFLSGKTSVINLYDWTRLFGTELWYLAKPTLSFPDMFNKFYQDKIKAKKFEPAESIFYNELDTKKTKYFELCFILIGLFAKHGEFSRTRQFNPYTNSSDCLDVKFLWLIEEYLSNIQASSPKRALNLGSMNIEHASLTVEEREFKYRLLNGFCYQLELLGLWDYAVYAVMIASSEVISEHNKIRFVRHLIQRNYKDTEILGSDTRQRGIKKKGVKKELLVEQLGIKASLLSESKAFKYLYTYRYSKGVKNLILCGAWRSAYYVLCRHLTPLTICNSIANGSDAERAKTSLRFVQKQLETVSGIRQNLSDWQKEGHVLQQYLNEILSQENGLGDSVGETKPTELVGLVNKLNEIEKIQEEEATSQIMIDKIRRDLILILVRRLSRALYQKHHDKVLDCFESLNKGLKEDKTGLALKYIEKDACF